MDEICLSAGECELHESHMTFSHKACSSLRREWKGWRNCKAKKTISFKIMNPISMLAAQRHLIPNNMISSKVFSKSHCISISKGEKLLSFHSQYFLLLGDFYFWRCVFKSLSLSGLVTGWYHISICLGMSVEMSLSIGLNFPFFLFFGKESSRGMSWHFPLSGEQTFQFSFSQSSVSF